MQTARASANCLRVSRKSCTKPIHSQGTRPAPRACLSTSSRVLANVKPVRGTNFRNEGKETWKQYWAEQWRLAKKDYPILLPIGIVGAFGGMALLGLVLWDDYTRVHPQFAAYPTDVEYHLRQALSAIHVFPEPAKAEMHFVKALQVAEDHGMDPYSPEVLGIRTRLAEMLEKFGQARAAVEVLGGTIKMCEDKVADIDRGVTKEQPEQMKTLRTQMLQTIIRSRVKESALRDSDYLQDRVAAKQILSDAVGLLVRESQDPQTKGFSEDNAAGLPLDEIASMLSQMGDLYATTGEEANAVQVYMLTLQPLRAACNGTRSCMEVQTLSNIASTMDLALKKPGATINGKPADATSRGAARRSILMWADQAIATAEVVKPEDRDDVCELGLISAEMTKADLLLEDGKSIQAREAFRSIIPRLREKGLDALVKTAETGLQRAGG